LDLSKAISQKRCKLGGNRKSHMSFRLVVPKSVTLNDLERRSGRYFVLFHRTRVQIKQLPRFQDLLLIVCDHIKTICAIFQRLFGQNEL